LHWCCHRRACNSSNMHCFLSYCHPLRVMINRPCGRIPNATAALAFRFWGSVIASGACFCDFDLWVFFVVGAVGCIIIVVVIIFQNRLDGGNHLLKWFGMRSRRSIWLCRLLHGCCDTIVTMMVLHCCSWCCCLHGGCFDRGSSSSRRRRRREITWSTFFFLWCL